MNSLDDLLVPDVFVAIATDKKSIETFFIIKITIGEQTSATDVTDKWGRCVKGGHGNIIVNL